MRQDAATPGATAPPPTISRRAAGTRLLLALGVVGPVSFWMLGGLAAATWPGYDPVAQSISLTVHAPNGWLQVLAFAIGGPITLGWAVGAGRVLGATLRDRRMVRTLFAIQAAIAVAFAILPTDADGQHTSLVGQLHLANFYLYAVTMPATLVLVGRVFARDPAWRAVAGPTFIAAALMVVSTVLVPFTVSGPLEPWLGLLERIYVAIPGVWQAAVAIRVLRSPEPRIAPGGAG
jgi:hypothetical protein